MIILVGNRKVVWEDGGSNPASYPMPAVTGGMRVSRSLSSFAQCEL